MPTKDRELCRGVGIEALANAVVEQAVDDYRAAAKIVATTSPNSSEPGEAYRHARAQGTICEVERFFASKWFGTLTKLDGAFVRARLRTEAARLKRRGVR